MLPDYIMEYIGRSDSMVKIRGYRIEPGEIENQLNKHENIKSAVVVPKTDKNQENYLRHVHRELHLNPK